MAKELASCVAFLLLCFVYMVIIKTQRKAEEKPHHRSRVTKVETKVLPFPGLA